MKPLIVVSSVALTGCMYSGAVWVKPGATEAERARDMAQCEYETMRSTQQLNYYPGGLARELDRAIRREELAAYCMKARGYYATGTKPPPQDPVGYAERPPAAAHVPPAGSAPTAAVVQPASYSGGDAFSQMNRKVEADTPAAPKMGKFTYEVEQFAKSERCSNDPKVMLTATGPGFENYSVPCADGDALAVRCEMGNCRALK
jgi:hypothetical protein